MSERDSWHALRRHTPARIALGRAGGSAPTREVLDFALAHALARDAVHAEFDAAGLGREIEALGLAVAHARSRAAERQQYLVRPDLGRRLADESVDALKRVTSSEPPDLAVVCSDGLSALAAHRQIPAVLGELAPLLARSGVRVGPVVIVPLARVAIEDEVGQILGARAALILLGERPGLGSPDSLGAYLVFGPAVGRTDAERNCVSNIRPEGLAIAAAARTVHYLVTRALRGQISGVGLKDDRDPRQMR